MTGGSDSNQWVFTASLTILLLCFTPPLGVFPPAQTSTGQHAGRISAAIQAAPFPSNRPFDYILIIVMENKNFNQINGSSSAPYLNQLAHNYSLATQYSGCDHPSLPNYMCLTGGNNYFSGTNCSPVGSCTTGNSSIGRHARPLLQECHGQLHLPDKSVHLLQQYRNQLDQMRQPRGPSELWRKRTT